MYTQRSIPIEIAPASTQSIQFLEFRQAVGFVCARDSGDIVLLKQFVIPTKDINPLMLPRWQFY